MKRFTLRYLLLALALLGILPQAVPAADPAENLMLREGIELYRAGRSEEALSNLRGFVFRHGDSPLLPEAYLYLGRIFLENGQAGEALLYLQRIPEDRRTPEAKVLEGTALAMTEQAGSGVPLLQSLNPAALSETDRRLRLQGLAEGNLRLNQPLAALFFLHQIASNPGAPVEAALQRAHLVLRDRLSDAELAEAAFMLAGTPIGEDARLQQALRAFSRGDENTARQLAVAIVREGIPFPYRRDAVLLIDRLAGNEPPERTIGVLLPLSGRYGAFGKLVRRGMELALQEQNPPSAKLLFIDTEGDPERAARAVTELVQGERVIGIAGPLTGGAAGAAAGRAEDHQVPLLTLSQRDGLTETGPFVFRNSLTSRLQVEALAEYAVDELKKTTFGILFPENRMGREMADLFRLAIIRRGGQVVAEESYIENATDFRAQVRRLQGREPSAVDEPDTEYPAPFEALFIPDYADRVGLIAPQLAFYGIENIQLLGINGWNSPELLRAAGSYLEGAVFPDGFFRASPYPHVVEFVRRYQEKYGEEPSILEAQGFDVAGILLHLLTDPRVVTREDLRLALERLDDYPGVTGATSFTPEGEAEKVLFFLQVQKGKFVQL